MKRMVRKSGHLSGSRRTILYSLATARVAAGKGCSHRKLKRKAAGGSLHRLVRPLITSPNSQALAWTCHL
jgi:hypothetical protein